MHACVAICISEKWGENREAIYFTYCFEWGSIRCIRQYVLSYTSRVRSTEGSAQETGYERTLLVLTHGTPRTLGVKSSKSL